MFDNILERYSNKGSFTFSPNERLESKCNAPTNQNGVYLIYQVEDDNRTLVFTDDNIEILLTFLNKERLKDLIEGETFDVGTKKSVVLS